MSTSSIAEFSSRADGLIENAVTGIGTEEYDKSKAVHVGYSRRLSRWSLEQLYQGSWICGNAVDAYPIEGTRKWVEIKLGSNQKLIKKFDDYQSRLDVKSAVRTASKWARLYGGAAILPIIEDGMPFNQPVDPSRIRSIRRLEILDSEDIRPYLLNDDPLDPTYYEMVVPPYIADRLAQELGPDIRTHAGVLVHKSRVVRFDGVPMPRRILEKNRGWGESIIQRIYETFSRFDTTDSAIANLVDEASVFTYAIEGLAEMLARADAKSEKVLRARLRALKQGKSIAKALIHDAQREKPGVISRQFTGLPDIMDRWMTRIAGATRIPMTVLFMRGPTGLASQGTGDTEEAMWAKLVAQFQEEEYSPRLRSPSTQLGLFDLIWLAKDGPTSGKTPEDWSFEFKPLIEETLDERLGSREKQANIDRTYKDLGVLLPEEIRDSRFAGSEYSYETVLDEKAWKKKKAEEEAMGGFGDDFGGDFGGQFDDPPPGSPPPGGPPGQPPGGRADSGDCDPVKAPASTRGRSRTSKTRSKRGAKVRDGLEEIEHDVDRADSALVKERIWIENPKVKGGGYWQERRVRPSRSSGSRLPAAIAGVAAVGAIAGAGVALSSRQGAKSVDTTSGSERGSAQGARTLGALVGVGSAAAGALMMHGAGADPVPSIIEGTGSGNGYGSLESEAEVLRRTRDRSIFSEQVANEYPNSVLGAVFRWNNDAITLTQQVGPKLREEGRERHAEMLRANLAIAGAMREELSAPNFDPKRVRVVRDEGGKPQNIASIRVNKNSVVVEGMLTSPANFSDQIKRAALAQIDSGEAIAFWGGSDPVKVRQKWEDKFSGGAKGHSSEMLEGLIREFPGRSIICNPISVNIPLFERAGFRSNGSGRHVLTPEAAARFIEMRDRNRNRTDSISLVDAQRWQADLDALEAEMGAFVGDTSDRSDAEDPDLADFIADRGLELSAEPTREWASQVRDWLRQNAGKGMSLPQMRDRLSEVYDRLESDPFADPLIQVSLLANLAGRDEVDKGPGR